MVGLKFEKNIITFLVKFDIHLHQSLEDCAPKMCIVPTHINGFSHKMGKLSILKSLRMQCNNICATVT